MSSSMNRYRNDFAIKFATLMEKRLHLWKKIQKEEIRSLYSWCALLVYLGASLFGFIPGRYEHNYNLTLHIWLAVIIFIVAIIINISITNKKYQGRIKKTLFRELLQVFGDDIHYLNANLDSQYQGTQNDYISNATFESSKLFNRTIEERMDDDVFYGTYNGVPFKMNETDFGWRAHDKHRTYHSMFKGIAMHFKLNKDVKSRLLIKSPKSIHLMDTPQFEKVTLEYDIFNKKYDVFVEKNIMGGSGQIEARYFLNTIFLDRFMQLKTSFNVGKICCSVYRNELLILLSTNKDLFELNHLFGRIDDMGQYNHLFEEFASVLSFIEVLNLASKTKL